MGIKKTLTSIIASTLVAGSAMVNPADAGISVGVDGTVGMTGLKLKNRSGNQNVSITGDTGTKYNWSRVKTYNLNMSGEASFNQGVLGIAPYIGFSSDTDIWKNFKIGKEFNFYNISEDETRTNEGDKYYIDSICDNPWGYWPNAGIYAEVKADNIFFLDKTLFEWGDREGNREKSDAIGTTLSLLMKLNYYKVDYTAFTARTPYGSEWYGPLSTTITSTKDLGSESGLASVLGLRGTLFLRQSGLVTSFFAEGGYGVPLNDFIEPTWEARLGMRIGY